jgi:drug/metabolite transporter (DMT)-like permease
MKATAYPPLAAKYTGSAIVQVHVAVALFGLAGLFGKLLPFHPAEIVFGRALFASASLFLVLGMVNRGARRRLRHDLLPILLAGILLAIHWVCFFRAIQISTVAIGLVTFASFPAFVTLLEPLAFRERFRAVDLAVTALVIVGLAIIIPKPQVANPITRGALWGIASGGLFAVLSLINRSLIRRQGAIRIAAIENLVAAIVLLPLVSIHSARPSATQWVELAVLGIVCTAIAHALFIGSMSRLRAQTASVAAALEPVYGIIIALIVLGEIPGWRTVLGGSVVISAAILSGLTRVSGRRAGA